jgi:hypothetical protein
VDALCGIITPTALEIIAALTFLKREVHFDRLQQRLGDCVSTPCGSVGSCFLTVWLSLDEDGFHAQPPASLNVGQRITNDNAVACISLGEVFECLFEEAGIRFTTVALPVVVGAVIDCVQSRVISCQVILHFVVKTFQLVVTRPNAMPR